MLIFIIILIFVFVVLFLSTRREDFAIEHIINYGILQSEELLKGEIFYRASSKDINENQSYYNYVRLNNGKDITIKNEDIYREFNIGDSLKFTKKIYIHKSQKLSFYLVELKDATEIRVCEEIEDLE